MIEVDVFDIQVRNKRFLVPKRAIEFCSLIQPSLALFRRSSLPMKGFPFSAGRHIDSRSMGRKLPAEIIRDPSPNRRIGVIALSL